MDVKASELIKVGQRWRLIEEVKCEKVRERRVRYLKVRMKNKYWMSDSPSRDQGFWSAYDIMVSLLRELPKHHSSDWEAFMTEWDTYYHKDFIEDWRKPGHEDDVLCQAWADKLEELFAEVHLWIKEIQHV